MTPYPDNVLIAGASRGIGLALARTILARSEARVFCASRDPDNAPKLIALREEYRGRVQPVVVNLESEASVEAAAQSVCEHTDSLPWIINTIGLLHEGPLQPERRLDDVDPGNFLRLFAVNSIGPMLLAKHFAPLLPRQNPCLFASLSARVGSIGDNRLGGWYGYRASKAAQNMLIRTLSIELKRRHRQIRCVALHPGTVATDLSAPFRGRVSDHKLFDVDTAASHLLDVIEQLDEDANGQFFAWDGQPIPW